MPNDKWDDDHIENLLRDFPTIRDNRTKEEVSRRLDKKTVVKKRPTPWLPLLVAALAFITISFLAASVLNQNGIDNAFMFGEESGEQSADKAQDAASSTMEEGAVEGDTGGSDENGAMEESAPATFPDEEPQSARTALYEEEMAGFTLFTIGLTENAMVIPMGFLIPDAQITADFGDVVPNSVDLYNQYAGQIDEPGMGFNEYHPYLGRLSSDGGTVKHVLPVDHQYDLASASYNVYMASLRETFADADSIVVQNEDGTPADFNQIGPVAPFTPAIENLAYYAYATARGETFLVPGYNMPHATAKEAFEALHSAPSDLLQNTIPETVDYTVVETESIVTIQFAAPFDFDAIEEAEGVRMLESLALTAKAFGKEAQLENTMQSEWNGFELSRPLPTPIVPNATAWRVK